MANRRFRLPPGPVTLASLLQKDCHDDLNAGLRWLSDHGLGNDFVIAVRVDGELGVFDGCANLGGSIQLLSAALLTMVQETQKQQ